LVLLFLAADEREHGSLRILTVNDPAAAWDLHGSIENLPAAGLDTFDGRADGVDVEVEIPALNRD
jgi:hypothetical protein